jgi:hypothetical protein
MIRNVITAAIFIAAIVSLASLAHIASAVEPELNLDISAYKGSLATPENSFAHPFAWTPDISQQQRIIKLYERMILPTSVEASGLSNELNAPQQRKYSFEIYQGDGLDDLREQSKHYNRLTLPDEDTEAYGVSVKQRF